MDLSLPEDVQAPAEAPDFDFPEDVDAPAESLLPPLPPAPSDSSPFGRIPPGGTPFGSAPKGKNTFGDSRNRAIPFGEVASGSAPSGSTDGTDNSSADQGRSSGPLTKLRSSVRGSEDVDQEVILAIRARQVKPAPVLFMQRTVEAVHKLCEGTSQKYLWGFCSIVDRHFAGRKQTRMSALRQDEVVAKMLCHLCRPTGSLTNVTLIQSIWWQRAVATRLLKNGAETTALEKMKDVQVLGKRIGSWRDADHLTSSDLEQAYASFHMDAMNFFLMLGDNDGLYRLKSVMVEIP